MTVFRESGRHAARVSSVLSVLSGLVLGLALLTGCSNGDEKPDIDDPSEVSSAVRLVYDSTSATPEPEAVKAPQGQVVFIGLTSDVGGRIEVDGYDVGQPVEPNQVSTLIISADEAGTFGVYLRGEGLDVHLADLEVEA